MQPPSCKSFLMNALAESELFGVSAQAASFTHGVCLASSFIPLAAEGAGGEGADTADVMRFFWERALEHTHMIACIDHTSSGAAGPSAITRTSTSRAAISNWPLRSLPSRRPAPAKARAG